jgi:acetolactate synthase-1/2/3 large subunit
MLMKKSQKIRVAKLSSSTGRKVAYTVSDFVFDSLRNQGVHDVYMLPGGGCMYLVDALARRSDLNVTTLLHEQSVGIAAEAHSQYTNNIAVALVTTGPGATNAITPCAAAWTDSTPVVFISGQVKTADSRGKFGVRQYGFQEVPIVDIVKPITKAAVSISNAREIPAALLDLITISQTGRPGPVWLDIPLDIQNMEISDSPLAKVHVSRNSKRASQEEIQKITKSWANSKRPILLIGNGVRISGAIQDFQELIRLTSTPALLSWKAIDLLGGDDPLNAGRPGAIAQRWSNFAQQSSDFILCIGARLDLGQVAYRLDAFAPRAEKYFVDIDPAELGKFNSLNGDQLNIDAKILLEQLLENARKDEIRPDTSLWLQQIQNWKEKYPLIQEKHRNPRSGANLYVFMDELSSLLKPDDIVVPGSSGGCSEITMQAFKVKLGQRILNSEALGPMGFGIPASIGVCIASGRKRIVSIDGDGGFLMNIQDLASIAHMNLPIKTFVLNNNGYGSIKSSQDSYFDGRRIGTDPSNGLALPSLEKIAYGFGIKYLRIEKNSDFRSIISEVLLDDFPTIIEIAVDLDQVTEPRTTTRVLSDGKFETAPMQYLKPALSEGEVETETSF